MNRRLVPVTIAGLVLAVVVDLVWVSAPFPGYAATIGLVGTIGLTVVAKWILSPLVDRPASFDGEDAAPDVQLDVWGVRADAEPDPARSAANEMTDDGSGGRRDG